MSSHMLRAIVCGSAMLALAAASIVLESQVSVPLAAEYDTMCLRQPDRLLWYDQQRFNAGKACISVYDLETDKLQLRSLRQIPMESNLLPDGQYVRLAQNGSTQSLFVMNRDTLEKVREVQLPALFDGELLNQRYLVTHQSGTMLVCDVLSSNPSQLRKLPLTGWHSKANTELYRVEGTSLFVEVSATPVVSTQIASPGPAVQTFIANVYRIDEDAIRQVATWTCGSSNSRMFRQDDMLLSLSPDGMRLEGRDLSSFQLVRSDPLPQAIASCLPWTQFKLDLCEVYNPIAKKRTLYRLDSLEQLQNAQGLLYQNWAVILEQSKSSYRLLRGDDSTVQRPNGRVAVYDLEQDKLVFDRAYDSYPAAELLDGDRLAVAHSHYGITAEIIDLKTGRTLEKVRPFAWLLPGYVLWAIAAACAAFAWIYYSARAGLSLLTSILVLAVAFVPIQVYPLTQHGTAVNFGRLATSNCLAILLSATAGLVWIAFSQLQNRTMRVTYQLGVLSIIAIALATLAQQNAFPQQWMLPGVLLIASLSAYAAFMGLMVMRFFGYRIQWRNSDQRAPSNPDILQFFALTAASAGLVVSCVPFQTIPWERLNNVGQVAGAAVPVAVPYLFIFLLLKLSDRWFQRWNYVAAAAAVLLVLDFIAAFVRPHLFTVSIVTANFRICLVGFVITFLWLWAFRLRGCSIARLSNVKSLG